MATGKKSPEYMTIRSHFHDICQAVGATPSIITPLTNDLCSIKVIGEATRSAVTSRKGTSSYEQGSELLSAAHVSIEYSTSKFYDFVSKLETHGHESLARKLFLHCESIGGQPAPPPSSTAATPTSSTSEVNKKLDLSNPFLQAPPTLINLTNWVASPLLHKWRDVGIQLGLRQGQMDAIYDQRNRVPSQCFTDVFEAWERQKIVPFNWAEMLKVLCSPSVNESELAVEIYEKLIINKK